MRESESSGVRTYRKQREKDRGTVVPSPFWCFLVTVLNRPFICLVFHHAVLVSVLLIHHLCGSLLLQTTVYTDDTGPLSVGRIVVVSCVRVVTEVAQKDEKVAAHLRLVRFAMMSSAGEESFGSVVSTKGGGSFPTHSRRGEVCPLEQTESLTRRFAEQIGAQHLSNMDRLTRWFEPLSVLLVCLLVVLWTKGKSPG